MMWKDQLRMTLSYLLLFALLFTVVELFGQNYYTYNSDRAFNSYADLNGYTFVPNKYDIGKQRLTLDPGQVQIYFTKDSVSVKGIQNLKQYKVVDYRQSAQGILTEFVDENSPSDQGSVKVFLDKNFLAYKLLFKTLNGEEISFYLPVKDDNLYKKEKRNYTRASDVKLKSYDQLIGKEVKPFLWIENNKKNQKLNRIPEEILSSFWFLDNKLIFNRSEEIFRYNVKNVTLFENFRSNSLIKSVIVLKIKGVKANKKSYLNELDELSVYVDQKNQIAFIQFGDSEYYLKP